MVECLHVFVLARGFIIFLGHGFCSLHGAPALRCDKTVDSRGVLDLHAGQFFLGGDLRLLAFGHCELACGFCRTLLDFRFGGEILNKLLLYAQQYSGFIIVHGLPCRFLGLLPLGVVIGIFLANGFVHGCLVGFGFIRFVRKLPCQFVGRKTVLLCDDAPFDNPLCLHLVREVLGCVHLRAGSMFTTDDVPHGTGSNIQRTRRHFLAHLIRNQVPIVFNFPSPFLPEVCQPFFCQQFHSLVLRLEDIIFDPFLGRVGQVVRDHAREFGKVAFHPAHFFNIFLGRKHPVEHLAHFVRQGYSILVPGNYRVDCFEPFCEAFEHRAEFSCRRLVFHDVGLNRFGKSFMGCFPAINVHLGPLIGSNAAVFHHLFKVCLLLLGSAPCFDFTPQGLNIIVPGLMDHRGSVCPFKQPDASFAFRERIKASLEVILLLLALVVPVHDADSVIIKHHEAAAICAAFISNSLHTVLVQHFRCFTLSAECVRKGSV